MTLLVLTVGVTNGAWGQSTPAPSDTALIALGQQLFQDPRLSADGTIRCASCHRPDKAYADGRRVAVGVYGRASTRNTPSLASIGRSGDTSFFWDGRRPTLEQAVLDPFINPVEMGLRDDRVLLSKLTADAAYFTAFAKRFPGTTTPITLIHVAAALSAYIRSLDQRTSAYDRYRSQHDLSTLSAQAQQGLIIFSGKGECAQCHQPNGSPVALTDHAYHRTGVGLGAVEQNLPALTQDVIERSLQGTDIGNRVATHADESQLGRFNVTRNPADIGMFRTPSLRGVALTAPYMHDGSVPTLDEAIDREVYYRSLQAGRPLNLTVREKQELRAFLEAL
ncbi:cytochrome c family protein [Rhodanobacter sp. C05]|nr:cytochrome c family protein [Rhodanobacter sp. C05]